MSLLRGRHAARCPGGPGTPSRDSARVRDGGGREGLDRRAVDERADAGGARAQDRGERAERGGVTDRGLAERHRQLERTRPVHDDRTAEGLRDEVAPRVLGVGPGRSESRDRDHRQRGAGPRADRSRSMPQSARLRIPGRLDHEVDTVEELPTSDATAAGATSTTAAPLVGVEVREHPRVGAERVTVGWLDLHHVGAEVGEDLAAPPRRDSGSDFDDAQIAQCLAHESPELR